MKIRYFAPILFFILMVIFFTLGLKKDPNHLPSVLIDKPLPSFISRDLFTNELITEKKFRGKIVLLNIWATWCAACQVEHPILMDIAREHQVLVIGINYKDERTSAIEYLKTRGNPYAANLFDPEGKLAMQLGVYGTPETFLIDREGIVRYRFIGYLTRDSWEKIVLPQIRKINRWRG